MNNILILASIVCAGLGLAVPSTILFCIAVYRWERRRT